MAFQRSLPVLSNMRNKTTQIKHLPRGSISSFPCLILVKITNILDQNIFFPKKMHFSCYNTCQAFYLYENKA